MFQLNVVAFFILALSVCQAKSGGLRASDSTSKVTVQPWLIGLAAVVGFLFIVFVLLIAQRLFFKKEKNDLEVHMIEENGYYENAAADFGANEETKQTSF